MTTALEQAAAALAAAAPIAAADPERPRFHFCPPAGSMNDVNAPLLVDGWYHIFYQLNPFYPHGGGDKGWCDRMHWGHAHSRDLVRWEHLPIALGPNLPDEFHCASGGGALDASGRPVVFYTSMSAKPFEQWAALPEDRELTRWKKYPGNPVLGYGAHGEPAFHRDWRDPFVFRHDNRAFMLVGATQAGLPLYECTDGSLLNWTYRGIIFEQADECPNLVRIGDQWVLFESCYGRDVTWWIGRFDPDAPKFTFVAQGVVDETRGFTPAYGTNIQIDASGRPILLSRILNWEKGFFPGVKAWNGCMALPRVLSIAPGNVLVQAPLPELSTLRRRHEQSKAVELNSSQKIVFTSDDNCYELRAAFRPGAAKSFGLHIGVGADGVAPAAIIQYLADEKSLDIAGAKFPLDLAPTNGVLDLHVFLDRTLLEVFVNGGRHTASKVIYPAPAATAVAAFASGGAVQLESFDAWQMAGIR